MSFSIYEVPPTNLNYFIKKYIRHQHVDSDICRYHESSSNIRINSYGCCDVWLEVESEDWNISRGNCFFRVTEGYHTYLLMEDRIDPISIIGKRTEREWIKYLNRLFRKEYRESYLDNKGYFPEEKVRRPGGGRAPFVKYLRREHIERFMQKIVKETDDPDVAKAFSGNIDFFCTIEDEKIGVEKLVQFQYVQQKDLHFMDDRIYPFINWWVDTEWIKYLYSLFGEEYKKWFEKQKEEKLFY